MTSTFVNDLRLNEQGTGDNPGSWGTVTNTNLELIAEAFSYGTETIGDADTTITMQDGTSDAARSLYLKIASSADLTTTRVITLAPNTVSKVWIIENATSGGQIITIKQGSGATINIPNGSVKVIATDGGGAGGIVYDLFTDLDLTGTTTVATLTTSGNVGIGASSPSVLLDLESANPIIRLTDSDASGTPECQISGAGGDLILDADRDNEKSTSIISFKVDGTQRAVFGASEAVFNEASNDYNFRVETDNNVFGLFVDAGNDHVCINTGTDYGGVLNVETTGNGDTVTLACTDTDASTGPVLVLKRAVTGADDDLLGRIRFDGQDDGGNNTTYARIDTQIVDASNGSEDSTLLIHSLTGGSERERVRITQAETVLNEDGHDLDFRVESDARANMFVVDGGVSQVGVGMVPDQSWGSNSVGINFGIADADAGWIGWQQISGADNFHMLWNVYHDNSDFRYASNNPAGKYTQNSGSHIFSHAANGSADAVISFIENLRMTSSGVVFNEGSNDLDFRVESDGNAQIFHVDGANNSIGVGTLGVSGAMFTISGPAGSSGSEIDTKAMHIIEGGFNTGNTFQVSDASSVSRFCVDGSGNVGVGTGSSTVSAKFQVQDSSLPKIQSNYNGAKHLDMGNGASGCGFSMTTGHFMTFNHQPFADRGTDTNLTERMRILADGKVGIGTTNDAVATQNTDQGVMISPSGRFFATADGHHDFNRQNDGELIRFRSAASMEGTISVSGSTVSYNGFSGTHETSGIANNVAVGTVCSTIDELDTYPTGSTKAGQTRADHAKIKVSDTEGDKRVYGVLQSYSEDSKPLVASVGIGSIRVTGACEGGDLLESNGDGTAKVQSDDVIRSKTIGKVTIGNSNTGVKLVSCVLYCG